MPLDKQNNSKAAKPLTPALSSHFRSAKGPLAPRLAGSNHSSPTLSPRPVELRGTPVGQEDVVLSTFSGHVTPRSGARNSRIGTESPITPATITVQGRTRAASINVVGLDDDVLGGGATGQGIPSSSQPSISATQPDIAAIVSSPSSAAGRRLSAEVQGGTISPQCIRARAAKTNSVVLEGPKRPKLPAKAFTFVHTSEYKSDKASGNSIQTSRSSSPHVDGKKFFRANEVAEKRPLLSKKHSASSVASLTNSPGLQQRSRSRPPSPLKSLTHQTQPLSPRRRVADAPDSNNVVPSDRRVSVGSHISTSRQAMHRKSASTSSSAAKHTPGAQYSSPKSELQLSPTVQKSTELTLPYQTPQSPHTCSPSSINVAYTDAFPQCEVHTTETAGLKRPSEAPQSPQSPILPHHHTALQRRTESISDPQSRPQSSSMSSDAAAARRERKVLDLEISNSSLLAINKTLEREMRKQTAELRRFRRLSRSGRLSLLPRRPLSGDSSRSIRSEDADSDGAQPDMDFHSLVNSFEDSELLDSDVSSEDNEDTDHKSVISTNSSNLSPSSRSKRKRLHDEKRLLLDLSRHQQLLVESQKLSQSIRRCNEWTEEMIREGNRALDYRVAVGEVKLGGRVLLHEDSATEYAQERRVTAAAHHQVQLDQAEQAPTSETLETSRTQTTIYTTPNRPQPVDEVQAALQPSPRFAPNG